RRTSRRARSHSTKNRSAAAADGSRRSARARPQPSLRLRSPQPSLRSPSLRASLHSRSLQPGPRARQGSDNGMCGIVGYVGHREAEGVLVGGLRKLEYRGYDSAGLAILDSGRLDVRRAVGKLDNLQSLLNGHPMAGTTGIGHTRWATHGRPSERNAHPHRAGDIVVIHNGIIENFLQLRGELAAAGCEMTSDTDTEVIGHLIEMERRSGKTLADATRAAIGRLRGSFAIVALSSSEPDRLVAAKNATPVVVGIGDGENIVASDIPALLDYTRDVLFLEDGEMAEVTATSVVVTTFAGAPVNRASRRITWDPVTAQKGGYKHFLLKEIHEQPVAIVDTLRGRLCQDTQTVC